MKEYELIWEIFNKCPRNQMRDVFFQEIETDDPVGTVRQMLRDESELELTVDDVDGENIIVYASCSGVVQKFVFSRI